MMQMLRSAVLVARIAAALHGAEAQLRCDTEALMIAVNEMHLACCPYGICISDAAEDGYQSVSREHRETCCETFRPFMASYSRGPCLPVLQTAEGAFPYGLHLRELAMTCDPDGTVEPAAVDCAPAAAMPIVMSCSQETAADAAFCQSTCYTELQPWIQECRDQVPDYVTKMLSTALDLVDQCQEQQGDEQGCDMAGLILTCRNDPPPDAVALSDMPRFCDNPCIRGMWPCANDPTLPIAFGSDLVTNIPRIKSMCVSPEQATGGDDGMCDMRVLVQQCGAGSSYEACGSDSACRCAHDCEHEMMECIDNPILSNVRDDILAVRQRCLGAPAPPKQQDPCASLSRADLCDRNTITLPGVEVCSHACAQEMIACIDSPRLANYRMEIESLQVRCRSESAECLPMVSPMRHLTMSLSDADRCCRPDWAAGCDLRRELLHGRRPGSVPARTAAAMHRRVRGYVRALLAELRPRTARDVQRGQPLPIHRREHGPLLLRLPGRTARAAHVPRAAGGGPFVRHQLQRLQLLRDHAGGVHMRQAPRA